MNLSTPTPRQQAHTTSVKNNPMTTKSTTALLALIAAAYLFAAAYLYFSHPNTSRAEAPTGLQATIATTSVESVTTTPILVFATSTCAARTISTTASPIMITFSDNQSFQPSGIQGFLQAASTTASYNGGLTGCGAMRIYSFVASTISVTESR
jgi:hypothetical protein